MKICFVLYPTAKVKTDEDTSFWIMHALAARGHEVFYFESRDLFMENSGPSALVRRSKTDPRLGFLPSPLSSKPVKLSSFDAIFVRKEPPFDAQYLWVLQILETLRGRTFVLNDPRGIAMFNEKLSILRFPSLVAETLVTDDPEAAARFVKKLGRAVVKPLDEKAGAGIFEARARDPKLLSKIAAASDDRRKRIMVQRYIDTGGRGDKRILLLDGKPLGVFTRKPAQGDFRSNLSLGGSMHPAKLEPKDLRVVRALAAELVKNGLYFVGIDVMDGRLIEINVTSPSGIPEVNALYGKKIHEDVADFVESKI